MMMNMDAEQRMIDSLKELTYNEKQEALKKTVLAKRVIRMAQFSFGVSLRNIIKGGN